MTVNDSLKVLGASVERLGRLVEPLDDEQLAAPAYPTEWTIADTLSHLGSGAVIFQRRVDDAVAGRSTPDDFAPGVWDVWNAKSPRQKADDALPADRAVVERMEAMTPEQRASFTTSMGPMTFGLEQFVGLRLNEHALHTWDVEVALDPAAVVAADAAALVVDNLELIGRFTAKPTGSTRTIAIRTTGPAREFTVDLSDDSVAFSVGAAGRDPDVVLPAEAFVRLVYGRLDPEHTPAFSGDAGALAELRKVYSGA